MVALIIQQSPIADSTDLWGTLNAVSEALGNTLGVVSHLLRGEFVGNVNNSSMTPHGDFTETVSTFIFR